MRALIVCSSFPPVNATAVHRTVALCRRLAGAGWGVSVLTMPPLPELGRDMALARKVPRAVEVLRPGPWTLRGLPRRRSRAMVPPPSAPVPAPAARARLSGRAKSWLAWWLRVPDTRTGWLVPAVRAGLAAARRTPPDVIYSTAPMWTAHLVGLCLRRRLDRPWVADCRDPWHANPFRRIPHAAHRRVDGWLEGRMVARAAAIVCNTAAARREFISRYGGSAHKFTVVPNGYDPDLIGSIRRGRLPPRNGVCRLVHAGGFYGTRSPGPLLGALAELVARRPKLRGAVRLVQVGPDRYDGRLLSELAAESGVGDMVEVVGPVPHADALRRVYECDVAVVAGHSGPASDLQIPRKLYEYLGLGKPILVTGGTCRAVAGLLADRRGRNVWLAGEGQATLAQAIERIVGRYQAGRLTRRSREPTEFSEERMAERLEEILASTAKASRRPVGLRPVAAEALPC